MSLEPVFSRVEELEDTIVNLLRDDLALGSPLQPRVLLRRLIACTDLVLRYPDSSDTVASAFKRLVQRHPISLSIDDTGALCWTDRRVFAQTSSRQVKKEVKNEEELPTESSAPGSSKRPRLDMALRQSLIDHTKPFVDVCDYSFWTACRQAQPKCDKVHFNPIIQPHTDRALGHCSYLNTCYRPETCRYIHFEIDDPGNTDNAQAIKRARLERVEAAARSAPSVSKAPLLPAQWLDCDLRSLKMSALGKFQVVMADPPWDIHQTLPYGTMNDDEMRALPIAQLQDVGGLLFLWCTGRALDLGRDCLAAWGYERIDELIWVKTNQLQRIIRTGRTGHWLNHSKEHCLVAYKKPSRGGPSTDERLTWANRGFDTDVILSEVRETSRKPDEVYDLIERACPGGRKLAVWKDAQYSYGLTLGNQLGSSRIYERDVVHALKASGYERPLELSFPPL